MYLGIDKSLIHSGESEQSIVETSGVTGLGITGIGIIETGIHLSVQPVVAGFLSGDERNMSDPNNNTGELRMLNYLVHDVHNSHL